MSGVSGTVLIGGGSGFVGKHLSSLLQTQGYGVKIISRMPGPQRMSWHELSKNGLPNDTTAVVNLAGQNVLDMKQKWNAGFKQNIWNSRINTTQALAQAITKSSEKPASFVLMTGIGIYEPSEKVEYTESSHTSEYDFLSSMCHEWEKSIQLPNDVNCRQVIIRSGVVLGRKGGMIQQLFLPFYLGLGGPIATGKQYLPWIHIDDICRMILFAIQNNNITGVLNGVAPQQVTNEEFTTAFAQALYRPAFIPVPELILNFLLSEERAKMLTQGQRVIPKRTQSLGFQYCYPDIYSACKEFAHL
ncbi:uncharacterized protein CBL_11555 [Carabus blaptoides fortunei]